uniref:Secreted protein n=1 Tax=Achlya hypogyna TaxID=1202772 RepID=A0A0A7CN16_ACHHY|nr:secreted protein [Achlya hypogyna]
MKFTTLLVATVFGQNTTTAPSSAPTPAPTKCLLQFTSPCKSSSECGDLNGFNLTCIKSGSNKQCNFNGGSTVAKDNQFKAADNLVYQFGDCSTASCTTGHGFTEGLPTTVTCQEPLVCVKEINDNPGVVLKSQCHTCGSCKAQSLKDTRFDCSKVCPLTPAPTTKAPKVPGATGSAASSGSGSETSAPATRAPKTGTPAPTAASSASTALVSGIAVVALAFAQLC